MALRFPFLLVVAALVLLGARAARSENVVFPTDAGVVNVTRPPYNARGDGRTDDTAALQKALDEHTGRGTILYLPNGVYLVSGTLRLPLKNPKGETNWGNTHLQGQSRAGVVLRLKDGAFPDPARPAAVLDSGPHGSADWFHNSVQNLTIDTGRNNRGAIGLRFFSNNTGCVRAVTLRSGDGQGRIGLDLAYNDMNGPLLVQDVAVRGFDVGIACGHSVNSQTFSRIRLDEQRQCGLRNDGQFLAVEDLRSRGAVPALENRSGLIALVGARLSGIGAANTRAAISNTADLYARDLRADGYRTALESAGRPVTGPAVSEFVSAAPIRLFPAPPRALHLPVREAPTVPWDDPATWASPAQFGARPDQEQDAAPAIQAAIDSGRTTVYLPKGRWRVGRTIQVRGKVRRLIGMESTLEPTAPLDRQAAPLLRVEPGTGPVVIERLRTNYENGPFFFLEQASERPLVLRDVAVDFQGPDAYRNTGHGPVFLENVVGGPFRFRRQSVWARQLNQETEGTHIENTGGALWILGLKTERGGTLIHTRGGGRTEVLGGLCYTTTAGKLAPMFVSEDASVSVTLGERHYGSDPYAVILRETHGKATKEFPATNPAYGRRLVLYRGGPPSASRTRGQGKPRIVVGREAGSAEKSLSETSKEQTP